MDRSIVNTGEIPRSQDFLFAQQASMVGLAKLSEAILGTGTIVAGLACTPNSPADLTVIVGPGQIYQQTNLEGSAYGVIAADTSHQIVKQGISLDDVQLSCPAPTTSGDSINYLVEVAFLEEDTTPVVVPYYNSADPTTAYSGPGNTGATINTERQGTCSIKVVAGSSAATGSQTTPAADSGYVGLYVVTVAYGATTIVAGDIAVYSGSVAISSLLDMSQSASLTTGVDSGVANAYAITLTPPPAALTPGMVVTVQNVLNTPTGASTLDVNGIGALPIYLDGSAITGTEFSAGDDCRLSLNEAGTAWNLLFSTTGFYAEKSSVLTVAPQDGYATTVQTASTTTSASVSFTAPCAGYAVGMAFLETAGILDQVVSVNCTINGNESNNDASTTPQLEFNVLSVSSGTAVTVTANAITGTTAPTINSVIRVLAFFVPSP